MRFIFGKVFGNILLFIFWVSKMLGVKIDGLLGFVEIVIKGFEFIIEDILVINVWEFYWWFFLS